MAVRTFPLTAAQVEDFMARLTTIEDMPKFWAQMTMHMVDEMARRKHDFWREIGVIAGEIEVRPGVDLEIDAENKQLVVTTEDQEAPAEEADRDAAAHEAAERQLPHKFIGTIKPGAIIWQDCQPLRLIDRYGPVTAATRFRFTRAYEDRFKGIADGFGSFRDGEMYGNGAIFVNGCDIEYVSGCESSSD